MGMGKFFSPEKPSSKLILDETGREAGEIIGNVSSALTVSGEEKFNASRGHGFAAERANTQYDKFHLKDAEVVGDDNAKDGMDRVVNGTNIQSKYCASGYRCIRECFNESGFRYFNKNSDGKPIIGDCMKIEVPADKYDEAVKAMAKRISDGEVQGITNPDKAKDIVLKGHYTYEQAKNIAQAGTVESLKYDAGNGVITAASSLSTAALIDFARSIWQGKSMSDASVAAVMSGLRSGGNTFATSLISGQLVKAGAPGLLKGLSDEAIKIIGPKAAAMLANSMRSGVDIYGAAAMKNASKMLRSNAVTSAVNMAVISVPDIYKAVTGQISKVELAKRLAKNGISIGAGTAGWAAGAAAGASIGSIVPGLGTAAGGTVGGILGSLAGSTAVEKAANAVDKPSAAEKAVAKAVEKPNTLESLAGKFIDMAGEKITGMASDFLLTPKETSVIAGAFNKKLDGSILKDLFMSNTKESLFTQIGGLALPIIEDIVKNRPFIAEPADKLLISGLKTVLETAYENNLSNHSAEVKK